MKDKATIGGKVISILGQVSGPKACVITATTELSMNFHLHIPISSVAHRASPKLSRDGDTISKGTILSLSPFFACVQRVEG
jgi:hypothetical protein